MDFLTKKTSEFLKAWNQIKILVKNYKMKLNLLIGTPVFLLYPPIFSVPTLIQESSFQTVSTTFKPLRKATRQTRIRMLRKWSVPFQRLFVRVDFRETTKFVKSQ